MQKETFAPVLGMPGSQRLERGPEISKPLLASIFAPKCLSELRLGEKEKHEGSKRGEKNVVLGDNAMRNLQDSDRVTLPLQNNSQDEDRVIPERY